MPASLAVSFSSVPTERHAHDLSQQIKSVHQLISLRYPFVDRIALALYDHDSDLLKTFISSSPETDDRLRKYEVELSKVPSLQALAQQRQSRLVEDIQSAFDGGSTHTNWLHAHGYRASYTTPIYDGDKLAGFLFYDSKLPGVFTPEIGQFMDNFSEIIVRLFLLQRRVVEGIVATVQVAVGLAKIRDIETGQHLSRMSAYARLMAKGMADEHGLTDEFVELIGLFAPLHDVGKVGIPDHILLKPGKLDADEWDVMRSHVQIGVGIIDQMDHEMGLAQSLPTRIMRNIVAQHHERCDGSGYPLGLKGGDISLEGRIVAVADVYDALNSRRPYKEAWTPQEVVEELDREVAAGRLDAECVAVLKQSEAACVKIRALYQDPD